MESEFKWLKINVVTKWNQKWKSNQGININLDSIIKVPQLLEEGRKNKEKYMLIKVDSPTLIIRAINKHQDI